MVRRIFEWVFDTVERAKGARHHTQSSNPQQTHYHVHMNSGYSFKIHCEELVTTTNYRLFLLPTTTSTTYRVYCELSSDVPETQRNRLDREMVFSCLVPFFCSSEFKRKAAIKAFLDLITHCGV